MIDYQWTSAVIAISIAIAIIWLVRFNHLHARHSIWWVVLALLIACVGAMPKLVDWFAAKLGVSYSPTLVILLALAVLLIKMLYADIGRSREQKQIRVLTQKVAILESQLQPEKSENRNSDPQ